MGNNAAYTTFERQVIETYNTGKLDESLLSIFMEEYRGTDIDSGGSRGLLTNDGKDVEIVIIETMGLTPPSKPKDENDDYQREEYYERKYALYRMISDRFDWR